MPAISMYTNLSTLYLKCVACITSCYWDKIPFKAAQERENLFQFTVQGWGVMATEPEAFHLSTPCQAVGNMSLSSLAPFHSAPNSSPWNAAICLLGVLLHLVDLIQKLSYRHSQKFVSIVTNHQNMEAFLTMKYFLTHNKSLPNPKFLNTVSNSVAKFIIFYLLYLNLQHIFRLYKGFGFYNLKIQFVSFELSFSLLNLGTMFLYRYLHLEDHLLTHFPQYVCNNNGNNNSNDGRNMIF